MQMFVNLCVYFVFHVFYVLCLPAQQQDKQQQQQQRSENSVATATTPPSGPAIPFSEDICKEQKNMLESEKKFKKKQSLTYLNTIHKNTMEIDSMKKNLKILNLRIEI